MATLTLDSTTEMLERDLQYISELFKGEMKMNEISIYEMKLMLKLRINTADKALLNVI